RTTAFAWQLLADDEGEDEAEERERLGEGDAEEHGRADHARRLGLAGHGRDRVADHEADADAGADGRAAVDDAATDGREALLELAGVLRSEKRNRQGVVLLDGTARGDLVLWMHRAADVDGGEDGEDVGLQ